MRTVEVPNGENKHGTQKNAAELTRPPRLSRLVPDG